MLRVMISMAIFLWYSSAAFTADMPMEKEHINSIEMRFMRIEPGSFTMGQASGGDWDERPTHEVTMSQSFYMSATEVTNAQYEQFDPGHKELRGEYGISKEDDEAVILVSWNDAAAFCQWLSKKEGKPYRLPTEAEWEYACRADTTTTYNTGDRLPEAYHKSQKDEWNPMPVPLHVGKTPANAWGLYDMHGSVEEWCYDWYGPYVEDEQTDPVGPAEGVFRVTRGGSHNTAVYYLRSANRMGTLPEDKHWLIGFRVVMGELPETDPLPEPEKPLWASDVSQQPYNWSSGPDMDKPYFKGPHRFVKIPSGSRGPMFSSHNHVPALAVCPNGDLLAIWYSCNQEKGRELTILASRLRSGSDEWDPAAPFWDAPDRNDHTPAIWSDDEGTIYHFNGLSAGYAYKTNLALIMRTSADNGVTWSEPRFINPERGISNQPVPSVFQTQEGYIILPSDEPWSRPSGATALWIGRDNGQTWSMADGKIDGIHGGVTQLNDGRLLAFGRFRNTGNNMPQSISDDMGETWTYSASEFPPINGGQRLVLMRLIEGPILLVSFTDTGKGVPQGMIIRDEAGEERRVYGVFAALSFDEGKTWPVKKLITAGDPAQNVQGFDMQQFVMDATHAEPRGYLAATQTPDGVIHLISSALHYCFNLTWLQQPMPEKAISVQTEGKLATTWGDIRVINGLPQNYPNPFNPDTWIPYQLAEDVDVTIRIYSAAGQLVGILDLGHKPAGLYTTKEKAAHWDGKNEAGEPVSSGVYFYTIQAGQFIAKGKMVIAR